MKWQLVFGILYVIVHAPAVFAHSDKVSSGSSSSSKISHESCPVKLLSMTPLSYSTEYISSEKLEIKEINSSYNALVHYFTAKKDLPSDTKAVIKIYGSTSESGTYKTINEGWSISLADTTHKYYKYLPSWLIEATKTTKQVLKGHYGNDDLGFFQFYKLLSAKQLKHPYFKMIYNFESPTVSVFSCDYRFKTL